MARFGIEQADNYSGSKSNFFNLKDDGDTARIRILINDINDLYGVSCHQVAVGNKQFDVECLREYNEPVEKCPLCAAKYKINAKIFIPVYDETDNTSKIWARGTKFFSKLSGLCERYSPLVSSVFEVERQGKKGDPHTEYQFYIINTDNKKLIDFDIPKPEDSVLLVKTADEINEFLKTGNFGNNARVQERQGAQNERQVPVRRRPAISEEDKF